MRKVQALVAVLPFGTSLLGALFVSALFFSTLLLSTTAIASTVLYEHRLPPGFGQIRLLKIGKRARMGHTSRGSSTRGKWLKK